MKKFISMVMAAAMVVTMVPATAFAANTATAKVVDAVEITGVQAETSVDVDDYTTMGTPQLQIKLTDVDSVAGTPDTYEIKLSFDKVNVDDTSLEVTDVNVYRPGDADEAILANGEDSAVVAVAVNADKDTATITLTEGASKDLKAGDVVAIDLGGVLKKDKVGTVGTVAVSGDFGKVDAMAFFSVVEKGIKVELEDDMVNVAPEEWDAIELLVIKPTAGVDFNDVLAFKYANRVDGTEGTNFAELKLKLNKGFEFANDADGEDVTVYYDDTVSTAGVVVDGDTVVLRVGNNFKRAEKMVIEGLEVEATTAKAGDVATIKVSSSNVDAVSVEVAKVVDFAVVMELVDADEDVPTFYNGVNVDNDGLTVDDDHVSLDVTIYETFEGAWSNHKDWTLSLPEGVHVVAVEADDDAGTWADIQADFEVAYQNGDHEYFKFKKRTFDETHTGTTPHEISFTMTLVADPDFVGDVVLTLEGAELETQEVVIAKVLAPYTIKAEQNDVIIDYRYTEVPTDIVITEAEAGLWEEGLEVAFAVERADMIQFEDDATIAVDEVSGMEIEDDFTLTATLADGVRASTVVAFRVDEVSDEEAAVVTISDIELFMQRNIPAGPYSLDVVANSATEAFLAEDLFAPDADEAIVDDVDDYSTTVHEAWINVVTAGRDQDDASFTTKVVVPVGESYIVAGDKQIALDVPAYINADGYTMLPVRAVATALGINNDAVQWNQATKTVIIMYGQRIITMTAGQSVVYVSGTAIPAASSVEIVDGRAFLGLRDLATTLGVATINWDPATKVASLN